MFEFFFIFMNMHGNLGSSRDEKNRLLHLLEYKVWTSLVS